MKKVFGKALCFLLFITVCSSCLFAQDNILPDKIPYRKGNKWGFCDRNKKMVIPAIYDKVGFFGLPPDNTFKPVPDTVAWVKKGGKVYWINKAGKRTGFIPRENHSDDIMEDTRIGEPDKMVFTDPKTGKKGLVFLKGKDTVLPARYEDMECASDESYYVTVKENGKWGIMLANTQKWLLLPEYDRVSGYYSGLDNKEEIYLIKRGNLNGLFIKDTLLLPVRYINIDVVSRPFTKVILVKDEKGTRMVDFSGKQLTTVLYQHLESVPGNYVHAKRNGKWGLMTYEGKEMITCKYDDINRYDIGGMFWVKIKGKDGLIDSNGTEYFED